MESTKKLVMVFKTSGGNNVSITLDNPIDNLTENQIKSAMQTIIEADIFVPNGEGLEKAIEAKIVTTNSKEYDLA